MGFTETVPWRTKMEVTVGIALGILCLIGLIIYAIKRHNNKKLEILKASGPRHRHHYSTDNPPSATPSPVNRTSAPSTSHSSDDRTSPSNDGDFATSMAAGYATNSPILGAVIGGSLTGGIIGATMNTSEHEPRPSGCAPAASFSDGGGYDSGSCSSDSSGGGGGSD